MEYVGFDVDWVGSDCVARNMKTPENKHFHHPLMTQDGIWNSWQGSASEAIYTVVVAMYGIIVSSTMMKRQRIPDHKPETP